VDERGGPGEVVFVLLLMQVAFGLLASLGEMLLMGTPLYAVLPLVRAVGLVVLAAKIVRGRRWAMIATIVLEWLGLLGVGLGVLLGLLPGLAPSITLMSLLSEVALPIAVIVLCALLLSRASRLRYGPPAWTGDRPTAPLWSGSQWSGSQWSGSQWSGSRWSGSR
jgi:hypothetical protein